MYTEQHLDALKQALASGELSVRWDGREITYRSISELREAINFVSAEIEKQNGTRRVRAVRIVVRKGV